jgi:hypothetical protein
MPDWSPYVSVSLLRSGIVYLKHRTEQPSNEELQKTRQSLLGN